MNLFSILTSKIFGGLLVAATGALIFTMIQLDRANSTIATLTEWQDTIIKSVRLASDNDDVTSKNAAAQINKLGVIRIKLKAAVAVQNNAIDALERDGRLAREAAAKAARERAAAIRRADALAKELRNRARVPAAANDMEAAVRNTQDKLYEVGL